MLENLSAWQKENGYKSKFVAAKLGLTESAYSKILHGAQPPTVEMAFKLREAFNVSDPLDLLKND